MDQDGAPLHSEDIMWARALAEGRRDALERYERELVPLIDAKLRARGFASDTIADIQQTLRARLLVGDGDGPAIARYEGRAALRSWILVSALREAVRVRDKASREPATDDDALIALADRVDASAPASDKQRYHEAFRLAFRAALASLAARDRVLLRMHVLDGLTIDQIAAVQGVHRATAARWIERARETVSRNVRRDLMKQLGADPFEADELLRWLQSRVELSLSALGSMT
jgi:RNA polymerase sigma-70 factor (ECF subfamily)